MTMDAALGSDDDTRPVVRASRLASGRRAVSLALHEWTKSFRMWRLWIALGMEDLSDRYRRTMLGISWVVTSFAAFIFVYIEIFGHGSGVTLAEYGLYVTVGFGLWSFVSSSVSNGCSVYTSSRNWIMGESIPYPVFFLQTVFRDFVVFMMTLLVIAAALVWKKQVWSPTTLWAIPGVLAYLLPPLWLGAILAPLCTRYRDVMHAIQTAMRVLFFATPILWLPSQRSGLAFIAKYNVLTYFIEIVRAPLLENTFPANAWIVVLLVNAVGIVVGFATYAATRDRIVYWL
jgi:ABC-type polysaccharide/polyol phosphate export permease